MYEAMLRLSVKDPKLVEMSLKPDVKSGRDVEVCIEVSKGMVVINIKSKKLSYLKAIVNSYLSLMSMLKGLEEVR